MDDRAKQAHGRSPRPARRSARAARLGFCVIAAASLLALSRPDAHAAFTQSVAVPAYFYPGPTWDRLEAAAPTVGFAVMNPDSGPGVAQDPAYVSQVAAAQAAAVRIYGYVDTAYAA